MQDQHTAALVAWFDSQGGKAQALSVRCENSLRGAFAARSIAAGEVVLHAPRHALLTIDSIEHSPIGLRLRHERATLCDHSFFAVFLADTRRRGSFWEPMVDAAPRSFPELPACFDRHDWDLLAGSHAGAITRRYVRRLRSDYRVIRAALPPELRPPFREFAWGWWASVTRTFTLRINGTSRTAMVPVAEMLNHSTDQNCDWSGDHTAGFELRARRPIAAGEELTISYGSRGNVDILSQYGFCIDRDDRDILRLDFTLPDSHFVHELPPQLDGETNANQFDIGRDPESAEVRRLLSFLRVASLPSLAVARARQEINEGHGQRVPAMDVDNECAALRTLVRACESQLAGFRDPIEEDERLLAGDVLSVRQRCAVRVRLGEKRLLREYIALGRNALEALGLPADARRPALQRHAYEQPFAAYYRHLLERLVPAAPAPAKPQPFSPVQSRDVTSHLHSQSHLSWLERTGPKVISRGQGAYVWDEHGHRFLDAMAGLWCATLGYSEPRLAAAATRQFEHLPFQHTFGDRTTRPIAELAGRLIELAPCAMSKVFFASSGSEANDTAVKLAWHYWTAMGQPERRKIISRDDAYHGSTIATASMTGMKAMQQDYGLPLPGFIRVSCPHHYRHGRPGETEEQFADRLAAELEETLQREGPHTVAAFFAEPVMGAGGVIVPPATYMAKIQAVLRRHGVLLVADEVVCGFGRTGRYWGSELLGMQPDMLVCAKGLTAGYAPMSALMISQGIYQTLRSHCDRRFGFAHGFTQSGNPVGAAVALEAIKIYEERAVCDNVLAMGDRLGAGLRTLAAHPLVGEVRGVGLMWAVELASDKVTKARFDPSWNIGWEAMQRAEAQGLMLRVTGEAMVLAPPLIVGTREVDHILGGIGAVLEQLEDVVAIRESQCRRAA
jgi:4-aminobutyrate--pyruvate transaminase